MGSAALRRARALHWWLWPLLAMGAIYYGSAQPDLSTGLGGLDLVARKLAHTTEYALLGLLWWRALRTAMTAPRATAVAIAICLAYAASDEYHQTFVRGRSGEVSDVLIDGAGAAAAILWLRRR